MSGHSHSYERSWQLDGHYGGSGTLVRGCHILGSSDHEYVKPRGLVPNQGTVYVVAGSSGKTSRMVGVHPAMCKSTRTLGSVVLEFVVSPTGPQLVGRFVTADGGDADLFTITKNDEAALRRAPRLCE